MKILILTQYFPPETGAPQNRLFEIALRLKRAGDQVHVLTAMPNYPKMRIFDNYRGKLFFKEEIEGIKVYRSFIYTSKNRSIIARLLNYFSFVFSSFIYGFFLRGKYDYLICESPPLFLGISALLISKIKNASLVFNVSDLWPESAEKLGIISNKFLLKWSEKLELHFYRKSKIVSGQTQGIIASIKARTDHNHTYWLPNGVDPEIFNPDNYSGVWRKNMGFNEDDFLLLYAGIIGYAQGLEVILQAAQILKGYPQIKFVLIGDGPEKEMLLNLKSSLDISNVFFYSNQEKKDMPDIIKSFNATIVPLKKIPLFLGAIPSKIFENLAMKVPVILGVEGEAKEIFIDKGKAGLAFEPENAQDLADKILAFYLNPDLLRNTAENGRKYVLEYFNRDKIAKDFRDYLYKVKEEK